MIELSNLIFYYLHYIFKSEVPKRIHIYGSKEYQYKSKQVPLKIYFLFLDSMPLH
jgi:hypothetical protein